MDLKKTINIVLIVVVLSLWGTVMYKYVNRFFGDDELTLAQVANYKNSTFSIIEKDTFKLEPLTKDPFLNKVFTKAIAQPKITRITPKAKVEVRSKLNTPFPLVQYFGYIKSEDKKDKLILLKINNRLERVRLNSIINGLVIKKIYKDSVIVSFNKETKSFIKN